MKCIDNILLLAYTLLLVLFCLVVNTLLLEYIYSVAYLKKSEKNCPDKYAEFAMFLTHYYMDKCTK